MKSKPKYYSDLTIEQCNKYLYDYKDTWEFLKKMKYKDKPADKNVSFGEWKSNRAMMLAYCGQEIDRFEKIIKWKEENENNEIKR